ncbi:TPA: hypothetical protein IAA87_04385 [Candidatus Avigastranaerophilus faecigallinarum]|nr:hypothetical protein [Candidatus Avigastranaerophilus faecigallinarum]
MIAILTINGNFDLYISKNTAVHIAIQQINCIYIMLENNLANGIVIKYISEG